MLTIILKKVIEGGKVGKVQNERCAFGKLIPLQIQSLPNTSSRENDTHISSLSIECTDLTDQQKAWTL